MQEVAKKSCDAIIYKIQTLVDGGARITLDVGGHDLDLITRLLQSKISGNDYFKVTFDLQESI